MFRTRDLTLSHTQLELMGNRVTRPYGADTSLGAPGSAQVGFLELHTPRTGTPGAGALHSLA